MTRFFKTTLRTSDVDAARRFYRTLLGERPLDIVQLHEQAVARGARPHWLGLLDVADVDASASAFIERGAMSLAPKWINPQGVEAAVLRDPGGALMAVAKADKPVGDESKGLDVVWCSLNTNDVERAKINYGELFGWEFQKPIELGEPGTMHPFAWQRGGAPVGSMSSVEGRTGVHPHWLFHVRVDDLDAAVSQVRTASGLALGPLSLPDGDRIAICDDPQGAAFALRSSAA